MILFDYLSFIYCLNLPYENLPKKFGTHTHKITPIAFPVNNSVQSISVQSIECAINLSVQSILECAINLFACELISVVSYQ